MSRAELELDSFALDPYCKLYLPLWKLDGNSFMSKDAYGHLCTNYGSLWTPQGRSFDGEDDYVDCGNDTSLDITDAITIEAWVKLGAMTTTENWIVDKSSLYLISVAGAGSNFYFYLTGANGAQSVIYAANFVQNIWYHLVATYNKDGTFDVYIDGVNKYSAAATAGAIGINASNLRIGGKTSGTYYGNFNGLIDEVRIYNRAAEIGEIKAHYCAGLDRLLANGLIDQQEYQTRIAIK